ncbi:DUF1858 domain-containing protein [Gaoshiqia sp. Z1-71]|uniref:DUF1858 domain-containing protein n=1 Tax=Gaoshiqia hydrogeniformans TaxID=3290090 RepID=UPI003BF8411A
MDPKNKLIITPKTKVGELLDAFPFLEDVLLELSPAFAKLKNPILRKTVARVASLQQAAVIGGLKVEELVNRLRTEAGQEALSGELENSAYLTHTPPGWFSAGKISRTFDASPAINSGGSPMAEILGLANRLQPGEILELKTPFVPAPIIDMLREKGFATFSMQHADGVTSYFIKD